MTDLDANAFEPGIAWPLERFQESMSDPTHEAEIAYLGQKPAGYMIVHYEPNQEVYVASLAVSSDARGHKLGEKLLLGGLSRAAQRGCETATLHVEIGNTPAEHLYDKYGFVPTGFLSQHYNGRDGKVMTLANLQSPQNRAFLQDRQQALRAEMGGFPSKTY
ncbi:unnamed protein product [Phaeothamnion confervicola]